MEGNHKPLATLILGAAPAMLLLISGCSLGKSTKGVSKSASHEAVPVTVAMAVRKTVPVEIRAIGNVQAYSTVSVRAQVSGELLRVHFAEGQEVKKGDLLFAIDPRPFEALLKQAEANMARNQAQLKQAEANLARDQAHAKNAAVEAQRYATLVEQGLVTNEQNDQMRTNAEALEASVRADRAAIENAQAAINADRAAVENTKIQLGYCSLRSQIDGRTGSLMVHPGNIVRTNDPAPLVIINQTHPIYVAFSLPEQALPDVKKHMAQRKLAVEAIVSKEEARSSRGELTFIDNTVDLTTGTIQLKATFPNQDRALWPGQFVNVVLTLKSQLNAVVVPTPAVQTGQNGSYAFIVKPDLTVESRTVVMGRQLELEVVIEKGLEAGEKVVTDGQLRLVPGAKVNIKSSEAAPSP